MWANNVGLNVGASGGTKTVSNGSITLNEIGNDEVYTLFSESSFPNGAKIPVNAGDKFTITWEYSESTANTESYLYVFGNASNSYMSYTAGRTKKLDYTVPSGVTYLTWRVGMGGNQQGRSVTYSNMMIQTKESYDAGFTDYQPYAMSNAEITAWILAQS